MGAAISSATAVYIALFCAYYAYLSTIMFLMWRRRDELLVRAREVPMAMLECFILVSAARRLILSVRSAGGMCGHVFRLPHDVLPESRS